MPAQEMMDRSWRNLPVRKASPENGQSDSPEQISKPDICRTLKKRLRSGQSKLSLRLRQVLL